MSFEPVTLAVKRAGEKRCMTYCVRRHKAAVRSTLEIGGSVDLLKVMQLTEPGYLRLDVDPATGIYRLLPVATRAGSLRVWKKCNQWRMRTCYDGALKELFPIPRPLPKECPEQCGAIPLQVLSVSPNEGLLFEHATDNAGGVQ